MKCCISFLIHDCYFQIYLTVLVHRNAEDLTSKPKLVTDDTSSFYTVTDPNATANQINNDLHSVRTWSYQRKMNFNPGTSKQAQEVIFSLKVKFSAHPQVIFNKIHYMKPPLKNILECFSITS